MYSDFSTRFKVLVIISDNNGDNDREYCRRGRCRGWRALKCVPPKRYVVGKESVFGLIIKL
jgi:hypothetical protein